MSEMQDIQECLQRKRFAFVGVSRSPGHFSRVLFREFLRRGYDPVPVNLEAREIEGRRCFRRVQDIDPPVEWALVTTSPKQSENVALDCAAAGIQRVWLFASVGQGSVSRAAVSYLRAKGIRVVAGRCPYLFWADASWYHKLHGALLKALGRWPA